MSIMCLTIDGVSLTPAVTEDLFNIARRMFREKDMVAKFLGNACTGVAKTEGQLLSWNGISGQHFQARILFGDVAPLRAEVSFIVSMEELSKPEGQPIEGSWFEGPVDEAQIPLEMRFWDPERPRYMN